MHVVLLTVLALSGANVSDHLISQGEPAACETCVAGHHHGHHKHGPIIGKPGTCLGAMPQSCYQPSFGCYPGTRYMNRYPAFHQTYYRNPYNYRNYFDYPWHAEMHEPTSHFSFHTQGYDGSGMQAPAPTVAPHPAEDSSAGIPRQGDLRAALLAPRIPTVMGENQDARTIRR